MSLLLAMAPGSSARLASALATVSGKALRFAERNSPPPGSIEMKTLPPLRRLAADSFDHLVILRIGHTGSYSFWDSVKQAWPSSTVLSIDWKDDDLAQAIDLMQKRGPEYCRKLRLIGLHKSYPIHNILPGQAQYVTLLRDPLRVRISEYFWQYNFRYDLSADWVSADIRAGMSLRDWVTKADDNMFTRWILSLENQTLDGHTEESAAHAVIEIIESKFLMVGITELFDESLFVFARLCGLTAVPKWRPLGRSNAPNLADLSAEVIGNIKAKSRIDQRLYDYCRSNFVERFGEEISFARKYVGSLNVEDRRTQ